MMRRGRQALSHAIAVVHEAGVSPQRWPEALAAVCELISAPRSGVLDIDVASGRLVGLAGYGFDPAAQRSYAERYFAIDPTWPVCFAAEPMRAITGYEHFPLRYRQKSEYFVDFAQANDIGDVIGVGTRPFGNQRTILSLQRTLDAPAFGRGDKSLLELITPHIEIAKRVEARLGDALRGKAELEAAFDRLAVPAFVVDAETRVRHTNEAGSGICARFPQVALRGGKLAFVDARVNGAFQAALRDAAGGPRRSAAVALPLAANQVGEIVVAPLAQLPLALVTVVPAPYQPQAIAARLQQAYRLTRAEAQVAERLALGQTLEEIGSSIGVSETTLRSQLKSIFAKTGTRRQAELVRLAVTGAVLT